MGWGRRRTHPSPFFDKNVNQGSYDVISCKNVILRELSSMRAPDAFVSLLFTATSTTTTEQARQCHASTETSGEILSWVPASQQTARRALSERVAGVIWS